MVRNVPSTSLLAVVVAAIAFAGDRQDDVPAAAQSARTDPDPVYFEDVVQPLMLRNCAFAGCHGDAGAGRLILERPDFTGRLTPEATAKNLDTALQFVKFKSPLESRLLLKPLMKKDGGLPHSGSNYQFKKDSEQFRIFSDWINGVELENVPPIADAGPNQDAKVGQAVALDGTKSRERRGLPLTFAWTVASAPDGSHPALEAADTATPRFKGDVEGAYTLSLAVSNGKLESQVRTVSVSLDTLPCVRIDAERASGLEGFYVAKDATANGGLALGVGQEAKKDAPARATFALTLPESGPYRIVARVKSAGPAAAGPITAGGTAPTLTFALDGGAPAPLERAAANAWQFVDVRSSEPAGDAAADATRARLDVAHGMVLSGSVAVEGGALATAGSEARPARFACDVPAPLAAGSLAANVVIARPKPLEAHAASAALLFHVKDDADFDFAAAEPGRSRLVIGRVARGVATVLAEQRRPLRPELVLALKVEFSESGAFLFCGDGEFLEAKLPKGGEPGAVGVASIGGARFDDLVLVADGKEIWRRDFPQDGAPQGWLAAGDHVLTVAADSAAAPSLDELFVFRADLAEGGDDVKRRSVRALYLDLLGRTPLPVESLMATSLSESQLAHRLIGSLEFFEQWYEEELYYFLLLDNFRPRTPQLEAIPARLANGSLDVRGAIREIVISQYFNARNPGNDTFVTVVLEQLLGITVQDEPKVLEAGKKMYDGYKSTLFGKQGAKQSDIVGIVIEQDAFAPVLLARAYRRYVRSDPDAKDLARWSEALRQDPRAFTAIVGEWFDSEAYRAARARPRTKTDFAWIRSLFVDVLERKPTFEEFRNFRNALQALSDSTPLRSVLVKVMLDSGQVPIPKRGMSDADARAWIATSFKKYLARSPTPAEMDAFAGALKEDGGSPEVVVHAVLCSPEYQMY